MNLECFCGKIFHDSYSYRKHIDTCELYQNLKSKYLTYDNFYNLYMIQRKPYNVFLKDYPYCKFCGYDVYALKKICNFPHLYKTKKGKFLTHDEICKIISYEFLQKYYVQQGMNANDICINILNGEFDHSCILNRLKETGIPKRDYKEIKQSDRVRSKISKVLRSEECRKRIEVTSIARFGVPNAVQNKEIKAKQIAAVRCKYGVDSPMKCETVKEKLGR